jgi:hypothetical protein
MHRFTYRKRSTIALCCHVAYFRLIPFFLAMAIPNFRGKHRFESLCTPEQFLGYMRAKRRRPARIRLPQAAVVHFHIVYSRIFKD